MAKITISVDESEIARMVQDIVAERMCKDYCAENRDTKHGVRKGVESAVKAYIYDHKEEITERAVERAAEGIKRKGLPKLIEKWEDEK